MDETVKTKLEHLNFSEILKYERPVHRGFRGEGGAPLNTCSGFCQDCEDCIPSLPKDGSSGILMSHGCTTDDYVKVIGQPLPEVKCDLPVMFLLENPGGDDGNGQSREIDGVTKNPPINHFYFSPSLHSWPTALSGNHYGDYFAYLMAKFGLSNVYITNCIKCKYGEGYYSETADNCIARFLEREIAIFQPRVIFCFGRRVSDELLWKRIQRPGKLSEVNFRKVLLLHPAARRRWEIIVQENDRRMSEALASIFAETQS